MSSSMTLPKPAALPKAALPALGLAALLGLTALSSFNAVTTERFAWDLAISRWVQKLTISDSLEEVLFYMGVLGLAGGIMVLAWLWLWSHGHRVGATALLLAILPNAGAFLLRDLFDRPRPPEDLINVIGGPQGSSYPSGHGLMVVFVYGFLLFLLTRHTRSRRAVYAGLALVLLYVPFTGLWLIHHGRHWPSDVFGGYLYGALVLILWIKLYALAEAWEARHPDFLTRATLQRLAVKLSRRVGTGAP